MSDQNSLLIFIKNPIPGKVKTRIADSVGDLEACEIYQSLLTYTRKVVDSISVRKVLYYNEFIDKYDDWSSSSFYKKLQKPGDLGQKMFAAIEEELGRSKRVCLVGSDIPKLTDKIITDAFDRLDYYDLVLGPATDGGYYLLATKNSYDYLFHEIEWSTSKVLSQTISIAIKNKLSVCLLPILSDVDYIEDWLKVEKQILDYIA